jgi:macrolide transport system ATP-binding/permease protein
MDALRQHLRFASRQLARNSAFTFTVIATLALAIGANTAIFSIVNALLLKSLPYDHPERIGTIFARITGPESSDQRANLNGEQWEMLRDNVPSLVSAVSSGLAAGVNLQATTAPGAQAQYVHAGRISAHYLDVLDIHPALGRNFSEIEDRPHGPNVAILSFDLWRNTFHADRTLLGRTILLKGEPYTVVGILPEGVPTPLEGDLYTALQPSREGEGQGTNFSIITRLREGATWQQADAELSRAWAARVSRFASRNPGSRVTYYTVPLQKGQTDTLRPQALTLMLAAGFILLIACANLAGLTLVRMLRRAPELATRLALGASRWQIQQQLWIENLLLAVLGGATGIGVGFLALRGLLALLPEHFLPIPDTSAITLDLRVLGFTLVVSLMTSILFGMLPALATRKLDLRSATSRATGGERLRLRQSLIAGEIALTVVLLAASGLLTRTLIHLQTLPPGFNPTGVLTAKASLDNAQYHDPAAFQKLVAESTAAMRQIPGVQDAAVGLTLPFERALNNGITLHDGPQAGQEVSSALVYVTPSYFSTLQMPLLAGRAFTDADTFATQPVAIVNQSFVRRFFHGVNPIGHTLDKSTRIVGVVADVTVAPGLNDQDAPLTSEETFYIPAAQADPKLLSLVHTWFQPSWIVRSSGGAATLAPQMQHALSSVAPDLPFSGFYRMNDLLARTLAMQRIEVALLSAMATLALILSSIGISALIANLVLQRTREIGIRIALGSTMRQAMLHIGSSGLKASAAGLLLGWASRRLPSGPCIASSTEWASTIPRLLLACCLRWERSRFLPRRCPRYALRGSIPHVLCVRNRLVGSSKQLWRCFRT